MGFGDYPAKGISTPNDKLMKELLAAQINGDDLTATGESINAGRLPKKKFPTDSFPGHAA